MILEGGGTLNWSALQAGIVQKVQAYVASKLFGGDRQQKPRLRGRDFYTPADAVAVNPDKNHSTGIGLADRRVSGGEQEANMGCLQES